MKPEKKPDVFEAPLGKSAKGSPLQVFSSYPLLHRHTLDQAPLLFVGGVHGDEPEGVWLAEDLLQFFRKNATDRPWLLVPCLNPDGFSARPYSRTNGNGVDLNRNFPSKDWNQEAKAPRYFPGPSPASESETAALISLIQSEQPEVIFHFHSWTNPCIIFTGKGEAWAKIFERSSQYPARPEIGYPTPGSLGQYGGQDLEIPVICVEELEGAERTASWSRFQGAFRELMIGNPKC
jgi:protein MpaA